MTACHKPAKGPEVTHVYPSSDSLPTNLLRFYVQFSEPMKTVGNLEKIRLIDQEGQTLENTIFNNVYELWDPSQQQLTIILDPARVKTGLDAHETLGRALEVGKTYRLVINGLENTNHHAQRVAFEKTFHTIPADTVSPDIAKWQPFFPNAQSHDPISIHFSDIIDQHSLQTRIIVVDDHQQAIPGQVYLSDQERHWAFHPEQAWTSGQYHIYIHARLADPAGNNLNGLFDHPIGSLRYESEEEVLEIPFRIE
ncbi:MAG: Ig-like domain-containing protein [Bacteroidota bacterium]